MADCAVADDIDERGLAGTQSTFKRRAKLLGPLDVLTVTIHKLEHPVVGQRSSSASLQMTSSIGAKCL
jgi:hypothetical protein